TDELRMHYFDSRGVARILELTINDRVWTFARTKPDFSPLDFCQRLTWTLSADGQTITGLAEISEDRSSGTNEREGHAPGAHRHRRGRPRGGNGVFHCTR